MPTYEYRCTNCGHMQEEFQSITDKPLTRCDNCSRDTLKRLISAGAGVIFKGSGFYETDYRSDSYHKAKKKEKESVSPHKNGDASSDSSSGPNGSGSDEN